MGLQRRRGVDKRRISQSTCCIVPNDRTALVTGSIGQVVNDSLHGAVGRDSASGSSDAAVGVARKGEPLEVVLRLFNAAHALAMIERVLAIAFCQRITARIRAFLRALAWGPIAHELVEQFPVRQLDRRRVEPAAVHDAHQRAPFAPGAERGSRSRYSPQARSFSVRGTRNPKPLRSCPTSSRRKPAAITTIGA